MTSEFEHRISVVIPTYNRAQTIMRAINSVLGQTLPAFEIIVVDDGSFDGTKDVLKAHSFFSKNAKVPQKKYFVQKNSGVSSARNLGIRKANGDFIAFLDSDDTWYQDKLSRQINYMIENNYSICGTLMDYRTNSYKSKITVGNTSNNQDFIKEARYMPFPISSLIIKSSCLKDDYFFSETLGTNKYGQIEDLEFISRLANKFTITIFPFSTGSYLINDKGATSMEFVKQRSASHQLSKLRIGGDVNLINDFSFKIKSTNKIKHENLRLKFITNFIDRKYFKALIYVLFLLFTNPYLTIKKISQQF